MKSILRDIRFAFRRFLRAPGPFIAAFIVLVLGVGANTAIFSLVDGIWLRPLAVADPAHLVGVQSVRNHAATDSDGEENGSSFAEFEDIRGRVPAFADAAAVDRRGVALPTTEGLQLLLADVVSDNFFTFLGVPAELGRAPGENELRSIHAPVIVLSHAAWVRFFAASPAVIGQSVTLRGAPATILGVMPATFRGTERMIDPQVYVPRSTWVMWNPDELKSGRDSRQFEVYARLRNAARPAEMLNQAKGQLRSLGEDLAAKYPQANDGRILTADWQTGVADRQAGMMKVLSLLLLAIAGAVLLIACTNVACLLLAQNDARRKEIAMRTALGATRGILLRQLVTEYAVLAAAGVAGAVMLARELILLVPALMPNIGFPLGFDFRIDHRVLAFTALAGAVSVLLCGLLPSLATTRTAPLEAMRAQGSSQVSGKTPVRRVFVIAQMAVSMALLVATGLLVRTLLQVEGMDMGFSSRQNAVLLGFATDQGGARRLAEFDSLVARMKALPGVKDASVSRVVPFPETGGGATKTVLAPGELPSETAGTPVRYNSVDDGFFRVMGVPLMRGRAFEARDTAESPRVVIVNQRLARQLFGSADVVGRRLRLGQKQTTDLEIVGVAADGKYGDLDESPQPYLYLPITQDDTSDMELIATTAGEPGPLIPLARRAVKQVNEKIVILNAETLTDHMRLVTYANRMAAWLSASLGGLALLLSTVGLYGVVAYAVSRRTHEIGIRMALGALRGTVFTDVLQDGLKLTLAGMVLGTGLAVLLGHGMRSLLFGVKPLDPLVLLTVALVVLTTSVAALAAPARRALCVNPSEALREE